MTRLKDLYKSKITSDLQEKFTYGSPMAIPKLEKIVVSMGVGKAVVSNHLVRADPRIRKLDGFEPMRVPVLLHYHKQPFYTELHKHILATLEENCPKLLG